MTTWVLLRGWGRERRHWGGFIECMQRRVRPQDRIVAIDLPGNGQLHLESSPRSVSGMVAACRRQLDGQEVSGRYAVLGLSLGAMVALEWSYRHPDEVAALVLANGSFGGYAWFGERLQPTAWPPLLRLARPGLSPLQRERRILALTSSSSHLHEEVAARWAGYATEQPVAPVNALRQLLAAARYRPPRRAPAVPVLLLASAKDRLVSPRCSDAFARAWALPLRLHPQAGHDLALDGGEWMAEQATGWWNALPSLKPPPAPTAS